MYSWGAWAPPPRGPRPSTVTGIDAAKWLASLAPPRPAATTLRPSASPVAASSPAVASRESMPGQTRSISVSIRAPPSSAGHAGEDGVERPVVVGPQVADELALAGHDVEGVARAHDRRDGRQPVVARGSVVRGDELRRLREREQRVDAAVGRPRVRLAPVRAHAQRPGGLALDHDRVMAVLGQLPGLEAQAGVEALEPRDVAEGRRAPLLIADEQQRRLAELGRPRCQRTQGAEGEHDAALHVDRAGTGEPVARLGHRAVGAMRDDRVDVADEQQPAGPGPEQAQHEVGRMLGRGARETLGGRLLGRQRGGDRQRLLGSSDVTRRRRDADERAQLALRPRGDAPGHLVHPRVDLNSLS